MSSSKLSGLLALLLVGGLAACDDSSITGPADGIEQAILEAMVDEDLSDAMLIDLDAALSEVIGAPAPSGGALLSVPNPEAIDDARVLMEQARERFREARQAWIEGRGEDAVALALQARMLVAEAYLLVFGEEAYDRLLDRVDHLITWLEERVDGETSDLLDSIRDLRDEAESLKDTDLVAATERLLLAIQAAHAEQVRHRHQEMVQHARHSVFMATMAIQLAGEIAGPDATAEQQHALRHALHVRNDAALALGAGRFRLAFALARGAVNISLVVVMLEPDLPDNKVLALIEVSDGAIADAEAAVANEPPNSFLVRLLEHIQLLQVRAIQISDSQPRAAIYILWHVAVTAEAITEMATAA